MLRSIGAVVVGYVVMACVVFAALTAGYWLLGADRAFQPGTYAVSALWAVTSLVVGLAAALLGGRISRVIAGRTAAPLALAALVIVLGAAIALPTLTATGGAVMRTGAVGVLDAMRNARTPGWLALLNPVVGALGVLIGGGVLTGRARAAATASTAR